MQSQVAQNTIEQYTARAKSLYVILLEVSMKPKTILLALGLSLFLAPVCFAQNLNIGTWKLNEAKSKIAAGAIFP